jgi:tetratricopeptide (TPR) repeat protein
LRRLLLTLFLALFPALLLAQQDVPEVARSLMEEAERARDGGRVDEAIDKFTRVLEVAPHLASAYVNLGALQHRQGKVEDAYQTFARGVERAPFDRTLLSNAAAAAQQLGRTAEALGYVDRALERNKRDAALHSLRATILRALQREDEALASLQQAVQLEPRDARIHFSLGNQLYALGKKNEAIDAYRRATELDRTLLRAYYNLGAVLFDVGRYDEALKAYRVALEPIDQTFAKGEAVDTIHARAYANLGAIYLRQQQWQQAADAYSKALDLDPQNAAVHYNLGFIHFSTSRFDQASDAYRKALAIDANLPLAYLHLGQIAHRRGEHEAAVQILMEGRARFEGETKLAALQTLARAETARGRRGAAAGAYEEILRDQPAHLDSLVALARIHRQEGRANDALRLIEQAQRIAPDNRTATLERALLARAAGDIAQERALTEKLLERDANRPESWPLRVNLALILLRQNQLADARRQLDAAIASAPQNQAPMVATLRSIKAVLLARDKQYAEAQREVAGSGSAVAAIVDALAGRRDNAVKVLQGMSSDPTLRTDLGLLLWQMGRGSDAAPHLASVDQTWADAVVAAGELALAAKNYDRAIELLATCTNPENRFALRGDALEATLGASEGICSRAREAYAFALLSAAAAEFDRPRQSRQLVERALALPLKNSLEAAALFLKASFDLDAGSTDSARDAFTRATRLGLNPAADAAAKRYLAQIREHEEAARAPDETPEATSATSRPVVAVFLPDVAADDKHVAEAIDALVRQVAAASGVALQTELFRRDDDARAFIGRNRERVGLVVANPEFVSGLGGFTPKYQFARDGRQSYRRVVIVPSNSNIRSLDDLRGRSISMVDGLRDLTSGSGATVTRVPDDLTAAANALYGKTDAALVAEDNPLLQQNESKLRVVHTAGSAGLPVVAFAPLPASDRESLLTALRSAARTLAPLRVSSLASLEPPRRERPQPKAIEVVSVPLGLTYAPAPPASVTYRVSLRLPEIALPEE